MYYWANATTCLPGQGRYYDPWLYWNAVCEECVVNDLNNHTVFV